MIGWHCLAFRPGSGRRFVSERVMSTASPESETVPPANPARPESGDSPEAALSVSSRKLHMPRRLRNIEYGSINTPPRREGGGLQWGVFDWLCVVVSLPYLLWITLHFVDGTRLDFFGLFLLFELAVPTFFAAGIALWRAGFPDGRYLPIWLLAGCVVGSFLLIGH